MAKDARFESFADAQMRLAFENAPIGIAVVDLGGGFARVNPALCRITGYPPDELLAVTFQDITHPDDLDKDLELAGQLRRGEITSYQMEKRYRRPDGSYVWVSLSGSIARSDSGEPLYFIAHVEDITDRVADREALEHHALHDALTGLVNRQFLMERLHQALELVERRRHEVAVLFCDLDEFKDINDTFGHDIGDEVLKEVADRISGVLRASDTAARLGGDEFVVLCEDIDDRIEAFQIVERIRQAVLEPVCYEDLRLHVTMSIGVAFAGSGDADLARLLREADRNMYRDKGRGHPPISGTLSGGPSR
jgi:diguanylate cyclase (GGDEF)-like protein/PAS domain S-box-containing protein